MVKKMTKLPTNKSRLMVMKLRFVLL